MTLCGDCWLETGSPGCGCTLVPLSVWGAKSFNPVPDRKTLLKIAEEDGLNPQKKGGKFYIVARKQEYKDLPKNLYYDGYRFRYRNPQTGERTWLPVETRKHEAVEAAIHLNAKLAPPVDIVAKILGTPDFTEAADEWISRQSGKAANTVKQYRSIHGKLVQEFRGPITAIALRGIADFIESQKPSMRNFYRLALVNIYGIAVAKGWVDENLPERTEKPRKPKRERPRLTLSQFHEIRDKAPEWLVIAMDLALYSLQRQGDILRLTYDDVQDGYIHLIQQKTGAAIRIEVGPKLAEVISRSKRSNVHSKFIVHKRNKANPMKTSVSAFQLQSEWRKLQTEKPYPTFHEIRSLGITMYRDKGIDPQGLAGHSTEGMTDSYDQEVRYQEVGTL